MLPTVAQIARAEPEFKQLSDEQLTAKTAEFRARIASAIEGITDPDEIIAAEKAALDDLLPEAFAVVREAAVRVVGMRHYDVQMIGGIVLHQGKISEMKTGEGKTLVATLPCYLNALAGHGVHVVTVNDYLAKRDAEWMGKIYGFLGLSVGVIVHDLSDEQRREAYGSDITYGTNNEFGFDYLRDNMKFDLKDTVQRGHFYCIVDEVDSILIDEARTPLIISGPTDKTTDKYAIANTIIPQLEEGEMIENFESQSKTWTGDFVVDEKARAITITDEGWEKVEKLLGIGNIADPENWDMKHHIEVATKAHALYKRDVEYVVKDGEIIIVDEFTGRLMPGRRWSDGLHQAIEAKEGVDIRKEDQTLATITFQNYFRLYKKLAGMTGTAETEAAEFESIYKLDIVVIPTNRPMQRIENPDVVYRTVKEKYFAVADEIERLHASKQPVLVGTTSIEKSELLSDILKRKAVRHVVLNAKFHEKEAEIVAQAGRLGMVTIATNMAGRGTDILLGGNPEFMARQDLVKRDLARAVSPAEGAIHPNAAAGFTRFYYQGQEFETTQQQWDEIIAAHESATKAEHDNVVEVGGLFILGTERHESRRVDNQLRGRAGRQGDPGASRFFLSLEDDLMRIFAREWVGTLLQASRHGRGRAHRVAHDLQAHRRRPEGRRSPELRVPQTRPRVRRRHEQAARSRLRPSPPAHGRRRAESSSSPRTTSPPSSPTSSTSSSPRRRTSSSGTSPASSTPSPTSSAPSSRRKPAPPTPKRSTPKSSPATTSAKPSSTSSSERYDVKEQILGPPNMRYHERVVMLSVLDGLWKDHLLNMDHLKEGIGLRGYAQVDPLVEYKKESFTMFEDMMMRFQEDTCRHLFRMQILAPDGTPIETMEQLATLQARFQQAPPQMPPPAQMPAPSPTHWQSNQPQQPAQQRPAAAPPPTVPTRAPQTTIDAARARVRPQQGTRTRRCPPGRRLNRQRQRLRSQTRRRQHRPQRSLLLRLRQEIQKMPRRQRITSPETRCPTHDDIFTVVKGGVRICDRLRDTLSHAPRTLRRSLLPRRIHRRP